MKKLVSIPHAIPFLVAVFLNAFVDLGHKIVIQNTIFKIYDGSDQVILTAIVNGLILLPFILLFSPAGWVSDRFPKHYVMKISAWVAVGLTVLITASYALGWFWVAFAMTFLLAVQSAFYSPAKYGYIKGFFGKQRLSEANGLVQAITIIAILAGTLVFSILFEMWFPENVTEKSQILQAIMPVGFLLIFNSVVELIMMYQLPNIDADVSPQNKSITKESTFSVKEYITGKSFISNLSLVLKEPAIRLSIIGLAMFWSVGQVMLAAFPAFAKESLGELNTVVIQGILASTGIGIAIGSLIAGRCSKNYIETGLVPVGAIGIAIGLFLLPTLGTATALAIDFLWIGAMGGLFIIPLNALIQYHAKDAALGKTIAANNLIQNIGMLGFLVITVLFSLMGMASEQLLQLIAVMAFVGGIYTVYKLPQSLVRFVLTFLMSRHYKTNVQGMQNIPEKGGVLLLGNHISFVDWAIVQIACPRPVHFVMEKSIYERWYLHWLLKSMGCVPIQAGASSKQSLEVVANLLNQGKVVCLFPEGMLSRTGHLAEFRKGYERAAILAQHTEENPVKIVPFYLHGLWGSQFSRSSSRLKAVRSTGFSREVMIAFGESIAKDTPADILKKRIFDLSIKSWEVHINTQPTLADVWIDTVKRQKTDFAIVDTLSSPLSSSKLLAVATAFARRIKKNSPEHNIGLLVPTSTGGVIANMAVLLAGKTLVNLNYTASLDALESAMQQADIQTIYTSKRFLKKLNDKGIDFSSLLEKVNVVYLEDIKECIGRIEMLIRWLAIKCLPAAALKILFVKKQSADATAAILFSSGSEGLPKGVQLSHRNILSNIKQVADVLNTKDDDRIMGSLPLFHAFGLTVTQFMPLIEGLPLVCHADPTDALGVAKAIVKYQVTVMCGTSTFLRLYCRNTKVHPLMLDSLRIVVSGAEKLNKDVRDAFKMKFNKTIYEGYGATETAPVASVNIPDAIDRSNYKIQQGSKVGTVGMPLPGASFKIVDPDSLSSETVEELPTGSDGMILIGGVQVMQGYINNPEKNAQAIKHIDDIRWYVTGDKGHVDEDGYLTIVDRYSRFAKLGGEMVSLTAVEQTIKTLLTLDKVDSDHEIMAINIPDEKKGERIVLLSTIHCEMSDIRNAMIDNQCNPLMIPSSLFTVAELPKLGSGKMDFSSARQIVLQSLYEAAVI
jgi:acyl-[acyl-carrier-protein]-phospholipid O-acyltransferase / long-chain-fatty-acid--[acyl-carrier-protein] ligase